MWQGRRPTAGGGGRKRGDCRDSLADRVPSRDSELETVTEFKLGPLALGIGIRYGPLQLSQTKNEDRRIRSSDHIGRKQSAELYEWPNLVA
jgi:hypothetical protein